MSTWLAVRAVRNNDEASYVAHEVGSDIITFGDLMHKMSNIKESDTIIKVKLIFLSKNYLV